MLDLEKYPEDKFPGNAANIIALNNYILIEKKTTTYIINPKNDIKTICMGEPVFCM